MGKASRTKKERREIPAEVKAELLARNEQNGRLQAFGQLRVTAEFLSEAVGLLQGEPAGLAASRQLEIVNSLRRKLAAEIVEALPTDRFEAALSAAEQE